MLFPQAHPAANTLSHTPDKENSKKLISTVKMAHNLK